MIQALFHRAILTGAAILWLALYWSCSTPKENPSIKPDEARMTIAIPPFPDGPKAPTFAQMADLLLPALQESQRKEGRALIAETILPAELATLASHPHPVKLARVVYEDLARELREAPPGEELVALRRAAARAEVRDLARQALSLAVARYVLEHPEAARSTALAGWMTPSVQALLGHTRNELAREAQAAHVHLEALATAIQSNQPQVWRELRIPILHARMSLGSARTGSFETAAGSLQDFLRAAGQSPMTLDVH